MEITVLILAHKAEADGSGTAHGVAEQCGAEIRWEAWRGVGDVEWTLRIPGGVNQGDLEGVDTDAMGTLILAQLPKQVAPDF